MAKRRVGTGLEMRMATLRNYESIDVNIFMKGEHSQEMAFARESMLDDDLRESAPQSVSATLRQKCHAEQRELIQMLTTVKESAALDEEGTGAVESPITSYWINNSVAATVNGSMLQEILKRDDVAYVEIDRHVDIEELLDGKKRKSGARKKSTKKKSTKKKAAKKKAAKKKAAKKGFSSKKKSPKRKSKKASKVTAATPDVEGMNATTSGGLQLDTGTSAAATTWSLQRINAPRLWQRNITGKGVLVAVIDTGVNYNHPDLKSRMWKGGPSFPHHGYNFAEHNNDPNDQHGHGTACAGQVAGTGKQGTKTGVAPGATVMAIRVGGRERNFWDAMQFAITNGADVISMSMSWKFPRSPNYPGWRRVCESILAAGILHANSIGNQGHKPATHPIPFNIATPGNCPPPRLHPLQSPRGGLSSVISCGATNDLDQLSTTSGRGPAAWEDRSFNDYPWDSGRDDGLIKPDVCAPGPGTTSCNWKFASGGSASAYRSFSGTSAATPHVGGCLALLAQACKKAGKPIIPARMQEALENTAVRVVGQLVDKENHYGAGRVDVYAAYEYGQNRGWW